MKLIEWFLTITRGSTAPVIFRKWIAVAMIAACLGRRCYTTTNIADGPFFPNLYILLVGEPGVGKTLQLNSARRLMKRVPGVDCGPDQITPQKLTQRLSDKCEKPEDVDENNVACGEAVMALFLDEFTSLVRRDDMDLMALLAGLYNCPKDYEYDTKHQGHDELHNVCINLLAGTQPDTLPDIVNSRSLGQGFPARLILIYSDEARKRRSFRDDYVRPKETERKLLRRLEKLTHMEGEFTWTVGAKDLYRKLEEEELPPVPSDPLLKHYTTRRMFFLAKLSVLMSAAETDDRAIRPKHIEQARELLLEAERDMPKALVGVGDNQHRIHDERAVQLVAKWQEENGTAMPEYRLRQFLLQNLPSHMVSATVDNLIAAKRLKAAGKAPIRNFKVDQ